MGGKGKGGNQGQFSAFGSSASSFGPGGRGLFNVSNVSPSLGGFGGKHQGGNISQGNNFSQGKSDNQGFNSHNASLYPSGNKYNNDKGGGKDYQYGKGGKFTNPFGGGKYNSGKGGKPGKKDKTSNPLVSELKELGGYQGDSTLERLSSLPQHLRHWEDVDALCMMQGKILAGSRDKSMSIWNGTMKGERMMLEQEKLTTLAASVSCLLYEANSQWLFVGLFNGQIRAFQKSPQLDLTLKGHEKAVTELFIFDKFLMSVSKDCSMRVWVYVPEKRTFENQLSIPSPVGEISCVRVMGSSVDHAKIWIGGDKGIASIDMKQLSIDGVIETPASVCGPFFVFNDEHVIVGLRDGSIKCYTMASGEQEFEQMPSGEQKMTHCMEMMAGPGGRILLLCGHDFGVITVYDVPSFEAIGYFCVHRQERPRIKSLCDCGNGEMFVVGTDKGDILLYKWGPGIASSGANNVPDLSLFDTAQATNGVNNPQQQIIQQSPQPQPSINPFTGAVLGGGNQQPMMAPNGVGGDMGSDMAML